MRLVIDTLGTESDPDVEDARGVEPVPMRYPVVIPLAFARAIGLAPAGAESGSPHRSGACRWTAALGACFRPRARTRGAGIPGRRHHILEGPGAAVDRAGAGATEWTASPELRSPRGHERRASRGSARADARR